LQQQLLLALADCHNAQSVPVAQALLSHSNPEIRKTALAVLGQLGPPAAPALLMALHSARTAEEKTIVLTGLRAMSGSAVDDVLLHALTSTLDRELQVELIRLLDNRGATKATPQILKLAEASDTNVRIAAFSALRSLAGSNEVSALVALTRSSPGQEVRNAAENALANVCSHSDDSASELVLKELNQSKAAEERNSWLRVLGQVGYAGALPAIEAAVADSASQVAYTAIEQLGHWPNPAPMKTLLKALDSAADDACRRRALVSVLDLATTAADDALAPESTIVSWLQRVTPVALSLEDKRRLIGLLGRLKTTQSLGLTLPYLEDPTVSTEAASAVVQIAPALLQADNAQTLKPALEKIAATVKNQELRDRAQRLASTISSSNGPVSLFDGHSLAGWEGDTNVWRVSEGLIVGGSLNGNVRNEFLATLRSYTNFLLRLEYKLVGTEGFVNSGVQFRSVRLTNPPNEMKGYQADIGAGYSGCLYDESRRNSVLARASQETIQRLEKTNDWNEYQIRAEGTHIQIWLNGQKTIDYAEPDAVIPQTGLIGLQIHGGNKAEVSFRNITLRELP
jgi:HEAT repeat protein